MADGKSIMNAIAGMFSGDQPSHEDGACPTCGQRKPAAAAPGPQHLLDNADPDKQKAAAASLGKAFGN